MVSKPDPATPDSLPDASHLIGELDSDLTASLRKDTRAIDGKPQRPTYVSGSSSTSSIHGELDGLIPTGPGEVLDKPERYEKLKPAPIDIPSTKRPEFVRRRSITVRLEKTSEAGKYQLSAEDPELRALLKQGFEKSKEGDIKKKRTKFSDLVFTKQFTAFDRQNPSSAASPFHGFFSLFWTGTALMLVRIAANNWRFYGSIFGGNEIIRLMMSRDIVILGLTDGIMCALTVVSLLIQKLVLWEWISWNRSGWIIQNIWQSFYIGFIIYWSKHRRWPWTHSVFIILHCIIMLMKQHSYGFYNGHLSEVLKKRHILVQKLKQLEDPDILSPSAASPLESSHATAYFDSKDLSQLSRRRNSNQKNGKPLEEVDQDVKAVASAIHSDAPLDFQQVRSLRKLISWEINASSDELKGPCQFTANHYPKNLTFKDFYGYIPLPTVVYELEYPRQEKINWFYVAEKTLATFGVIGTMIVISQAYIYPVVMSVKQMQEAGVPLRERMLEFPWTFSDLLFPMMMEYMLAWYVIWECVLNVLAELTGFADRSFYADWWNSTSWDQFARDWNRPVHNFLLRFSYHSSISTFRLSRSSATLVTFLLSACVHELVMAMIFGKIRGYLLMLQMCQLPMVVLSRTKFLKGRDILGNFIFWLGIFLGPSLLFTMYLFF